MMSDYILLKSFDDDDNNPQIIFETFTCDLDVVDEILSDKIPEFFLEYNHFSSLQVECIKIASSNVYLPKA
jgi:hypothetical protein